MTVETAELGIDSLAAGGDGVGRTAGIVVFVPRTAPGDLVRVHMERHKRFARGEVESLLRPSPQRVEPPCRHYVVDRCGGCQIQHLGYAAQLAAKAGIIRDALERIGKRQVGLPEVVPSDREWRYRTKLTMAMRRQPWGWVVGLHPYDDPVGVFALEDCPITDERVLATWREVIGAAGLFPAADELRASVRLVPGGSAIVMEGATEWPAREEFFAAVPSAVALWWKPEGQSRRMVSERAAAPGGASFGQVNPGVAARLRTHVLERVLAHRPSTVVDAYAGTGDTAVPLAESGIRVTAIELDREAATRCAQRLPAGSRSLGGRVEDLLPRALPADVVLLNPPRTGVDERVTRLLAQVESAPRAVVYVSCNPATLARDVARMPRYRVASLLGFDMFPQTAHVETVCELIPEAA